MVVILRSKPRTVPAFFIITISITYIKDSTLFSDESTMITANVFYFRVGWDCVTLMNDNYSVLVPDWNVVSQILVHYNVSLPNWLVRVFIRKGTLQEETIFSTHTLLTNWIQTFCPFCVSWLKRVLNRWPLNYGTFISFTYNECKYHIYRFRFRSIK